MQKQDTKTTDPEGTNTVKHIKKIEAQPATGRPDSTGKPEIRTANGCIPVGV